jgi:arylsulfatase A-like enzyme
MNTPRFLLALLALCLSVPAFAADPARPPNVVLIFCDDLGYADVGPFGAKEIATPTLDRMAKEGVRLTDFHTCSPVCTPSRAALLTGTYAARIGLANHVLFPKARIGLSPGEVTIAKLLKGRGYATACVGKWHVGDAAEFGPLAHGFDSYFGLPYSNDMRVRRGEAVGPPLVRGTEVVEHPADQSTLTERYTDEAVRFITANKGRPFFLYLPHTFPHIPLHASARFKGKSKGGLYGDCVEAIDWSTGRILDTIKTLGLDDDTLVIFTSDNGPWLEQKKNGGSALPLRAGKGTVYEGGHRVPFIVRWPGRIPAGKACDAFATTMDLYPTLARLAGATVPGDRVIDGREIWPLLSAADGARSPHDVFFHHTANGPLGAVRAGSWKLILPRQEKPNKDAAAVAKPAELYDLANDLSETTNVAAAHADVVDRLTRLADAHRADIAANNRPVGRLNAAAAAPATPAATPAGPAVPAKGRND